MVMLLLPPRTFVLVSNPPSDTIDDRPCSGGAAIVELNERIAEVPRLLTREQLLTLPERNMFCLEFAR